VNNTLQAQLAYVLGSTPRDTDIADDPPTGGDTQMASVRVRGDSIGMGSVEGPSYISMEELQSALTSQRVIHAMKVRGKHLFTTS